MVYHTTVLLHDGVNALVTNPGGVYVDVTLGAGGHSREILNRLDSEGLLLGFDQDADAVKNVPEDKRFKFCFGNFRFLKQFLLSHGVSQVDGIIADFGVSGHQFDEGSRGFSFRFDSELDMRMNRSQGRSAKEVLNESEPGDLVRILKAYGESAFARPIVKKIVLKRSEKQLETTGDLVQIVESVVPEHKRKSELAKVFQAIRIEVNDEIKVIEEFLQQSVDVIKPGGRLVLISYHSLEDRPVKRFLRSGNFDDKMNKDVFGNVLRPFNPIGKVVVPTPEEIEQNPRARSAKMRIAERVNG